MTLPNLRRSLSLTVALLGLIPAHAQVAPAPSAATTTATPPAKKPAPAPVVTKSTDDAAPQPVTLTPFEVTSDLDRGYQASSALSGSRLNTKLEDIAASLSVVTKQQLLDTAATDINDIFKYELNTEGIYQFTSFTVDRGNISDDVQSNPSGATRMRGLSSANVANNSFATTLPLDTYNIESVEISRGPNSTIFGLGNAGGGVNINSARANPYKAVTTFATSGDSYDGYRASFDINRPLIAKKLAVRVLGLREEKGYVRQPSEDITRRLQGAVTYRPFESTTLRASFESYRNYNSRPNSATPRDSISDWIASGKPTWDPITQTARLANGTTTGPILQANEVTQLPYGIATTDTAFTTFPSWYIEAGKVQLYSINRLPAATGTGPNNVGGTLRLLQNGTFLSRAVNANAAPLFLTPGVSNKAFYDWTSVNLGAANSGTVKGETSLVELEQIVLRTPRQTLAFQGGWLYERVGTTARTLTGSSQVYIDINEKLLDGSTNPYFLRPYVAASEPNSRKGRNVAENYRGTVAYSLDLNRESNILRFLGKSTFSGYGEYRTVRSGNLGFKDTMSSTEAWMNGTPASRNSSSYRAYARSYVGDTNGYNVDYAPTGLPTSNGKAAYNLRYLNGVTNEWINEPVEFDEYYYANRLSRRILSTVGAVWQGSLWNDRIRPVYGARRDMNRTRDGNNAINPTVATNGYYDLSDMDNFGQADWVPVAGGDLPRAGNTTNAGVVVRTFKWLDLSYSQSSSFSPGSLAYNVYGQPLPDPRAKTKDYGFAVFFGDYLRIAAKQYETVSYGRGTSELNTLVQRAIRLDADGNTTAGDPDLYAFLRNDYAATRPDLSVAQTDAEILKLMGVDAAFINSHRNKTHGDASDAVSRGKEIEITFNPTKFWTLRSTITQSRPLNGTISPQLQDYIASRLPTWTTVRGPSGTLWWNATQVNTTPQAWYTTNLLAPTKLAIALQGKPRSQVREWRVNAVTNYKLAGITDNKWFKPLDIGGAVRWEDRATIGFLAGQADPDGIVRSLDANKPAWDKAHAYYDLMAGANLRFFKGKIRTRVQLNVSNVFEDGRLQAVAINPDGSPYLYRIIDPRKFTLTATFSL